MNATPEYADEIERDFLSTLPTFDEYSNAVYDITYLKLQNQAITDLYKALTNRTKTLQQLSEDTGLDVDLRNINNMRNYIKREKERIERKTNRIKNNLANKDFCKLILLKNEDLEVIDIDNKSVIKINIPRPI